MSHSELRMRHVQNLYKNEPSTAGSVNGDVFYVQRDKLSASVTLHPEFPTIPPTIHIQPPMRHPMLDQRMVVCFHEYITNWRMHSELGKVVSTILDELQSSLNGGFAPPQQQQQSFQPQTQTHTHQHSQHQQQQYTQPTPNPDASRLARLGLPPVPDHFTELERFSHEELLALNEDEGKFVEFFSKLPMVKKLEEIEKNLKEENKAIAKQNLARKPELEHRKELLLQQHKELESKRGEYETLKAKYESLQKSLSPTAVLEQLNLAESKARQEADNLETSFQRGEMGLNEFIERFKKIKEKQHLLKNKSVAFQASMR
eukprot:m.334791 g.334791  ORF g.334791 m.334791 type:complete len:316 (-) comp17440_c0_seq1:141-1088(-)